MYIHIIHNVSTQIYMTLVYMCMCVSQNVESFLRVLNTISVPLFYSSVIEITWMLFLPFLSSFSSTFHFILFNPFLKSHFYSFGFCLLLFISIINFWIYESRWFFILLNAFMNIFNSTLTIIIQFTSNLWLLFQGEFPSIGICWLPIFLAIFTVLKWFYKISSLMVLCHCCNIQLLSGCSSLFWWC